MKETLFEILWDFYHNYIYEDLEHHEQWEIMDLEHAVSMLNNYLEQAIDLMQQEEMPKPDEKALRIFTNEECSKLGVDARNFLLSLQNKAIIDAKLREAFLSLVLEQDDQLTAQQMKTLVLSNIKILPETKAAWLEYVCHKDDMAIH